jgi:hypothetical protein
MEVWDQGGMEVEDQGGMEVADHLDPKPDFQDLRNVQLATMFLTIFQLIWIYSEKM